MCGQFILKIDENQLELDFGVKFKNVTGKKQFHFDALAFSKERPEIPILYSYKDNFVLQNAFWGLAPDWVEEYPPLFSTYNARKTRPQKNNQQELEFIYDVPAFKEAFRNNQFCLIPVTECFEFSYFGEFGGNKVKYFLPDSSFYILGLYNHWMGKSGNKILTTTMMTDAPTKFHYSIGHDRSVVTLPMRDAINLLSKKMSYKEAFDFIHSRRIVHPWVGAVVNPMKEGWQSRGPDMIDLINIQSEVWE